MDEIFDETERALRQQWISDEWIAVQLKEIAEEAYKMSKDGTPNPDYASRMRALDMIAKLLKKYNSSPTINIVNAFSNIDTVR